MHLALLLLALQTPFPDPIGTDVGGALSPGFEPSGVATTTAGSLIVVSDNGRYLVMEPSGQVTLPERDVGQEDFEGTTDARVADFAYFGIEHVDAIVELELATGDERRSFDLTAFMAGQDNQGLEALTFVPDAAHPEGGTFFVGHQGEARVYRVELPILSSTSDESVNLLGTLDPPGAPRDDLSGLFYDTGRGSLFWVFGNERVFVETTTEGALLNEWSLPGVDQEGVALIDCALFIAEDTSGRLMRYRAPDCSTVDAGPDAGPERADAGPERADAGPERADAGPDAGPDREDAGRQNVADAGRDAGRAVTPDAGRPREVDAGPVVIVEDCDCDNSGGRAPFAGLSLVALALFFRKRSRASG